MGPILTCPMSLCARLYPSRQVVEGRSHVYLFLRLENKPPLMPTGYLCHFCSKRRRQGEGVRGGKRRESVGRKRKKDGVKTKWRRSIGCRRRKRREGNGQVTQLSSGLGCLKKGRWWEEKKGQMLTSYWGWSERTWPNGREFSRRRGKMDDESEGVGGLDTPRSGGGTGRRRWQEMSILEEGKERRRGGVWAEMYLFSFAGKYLIKVRISAANHKGPPLVCGSRRVAGEQAEAFAVQTAAIREGGKKKRNTVFNSQQNPAERTLPLPPLPPALFWSLIFVFVSLSSSSVLSATVFSLTAP